MKEYRLKINGGYDFIVIAPKTLSSLISKIHDSSETELCVRVEDIMPSDFAKYLVNVINSNREASICFRYRQTVADSITKRELYRLMQEQLDMMDINSEKCFDTIRLIDTLNGEAGFDVVCTEPFFWACKDSAARFVYTFPDGRQETLVIEY